VEGRSTVLNPLGRQTSHLIYLSGMASGWLYEMIKRGVPPKPKRAEPASRDAYRKVNNGYGEVNQRALANETELLWNL
jgi:hypothetical protein